MELTQVDILGLVAGVVVAASLSMSDAVKLRLLNGIGAVLWIGYGCLVEPFAMPVVAFNVWIFFADIYYLKKALAERAAT